MLAIRVLSIAGALVMVAAIGFGFTSGDFSGEGAEIWALAWGKVTLIDLYVGLLLFGAWVAFREGRWLRVVLWWLLLMVLGNLAAAVYVARAAFASSNPRQLLLGPSR